MLITYTPNYTLTPTIAHDLMRIEKVRTQVLHLPLTPTVLASLRETARLVTTHYSTMIEGNRLSAEEIDTVLQHKGHFPGRERDEREVRGYYAAMTQVEQWAKRSAPLTEKMVQTIHGLVMADGRTRVKPTPYRDGQNVIRDGATRAIVYLPPESKDVPELMQELVAWINSSHEIPAPIVAGIAHYQFATIHPYYDGNGRTARLLTTWVLHQRGYDLKGLYSLEEYYARHLGAYYAAISVGESHNYYEGRADADISRWVAYFVAGMAVSFEVVCQRMAAAGTAPGVADRSALLRELDPRQRKVLLLFEEFATITAKQVSELFGFQARTGAKLCQQWVAAGLLEVVDFSNKGRRYRLAERYRA